MTRWLLILVCWIVSFLFSGIEAGLLAIDPVRLRSQAKKGETAAVRLQRLLRHPERLLVTVLLVTNMADILALILLTHRFVRSFGSSGFLFALLAALPIYVFVLGVLPKSLFRRFPFRALASLGRMLEIVSTALWPVLELGKQFGRLFLPAKSERAARLFAAREELKQITAQSEAEGSLTATERVMIHNVVDFTTVKASNVMVPLEQAVTIRPTTPVAEILQLSESTHIDRMPVVSEKGDAVGLVNVPDILFDQEHGPTNKYIRRIVTAAADEPAYRLIQRLRAARLGLAAVIDARMKLIGVVTSEDLIKRLVSAAPVNIPS
jgi:CBS domain containing-hemolysin-like protein